MSLQKHLLSFVVRLPRVVSSNECGKFVDRMTKASILRARPQIGSFLCTEIVVGRWFNVFKWQCTCVFTFDFTFRIIHDPVGRVGCVDYAVEIAGSIASAFFVLLVLRCACSLDSTNSSDKSTMRFLLTQTATGKRPDSKNIEEIKKSCKWLSTILFTATNPKHTQCIFNMHGIFSIMAHNFKMTERYGIKLKWRNLNLHEVRRKRKMHFPKLFSANGAKLGAVECVWNLLIFINKMPAIEEIETWKLCWQYYHDTHSLFLQPIHWHKPCIFCAILKFQEAFNAKVPR